MIHQRAHKLLNFYLFVKAIILNTQQNTTLQARLPHLSGIFYKGFEKPSETTFN